MMITTWKCALAAAICCAVVATGGPASAAMIGINLTGFRVQYTTSADRLNDMQSELGDNQNPAQAVLLNTAEFSVDDTLIEQYNQAAGNNTYADLLLTNIAPGLLLPTSVAAPSIVQANNNDAFGFEWFYNDGGTMRSLHLVLDQTTILLLANASNPQRPTMVISGSTTNWTQDNLPGGIQFTPGTPITFSYTTTNTMPFDVMPDNSFTSILASGGVMEISGEGSIGIPEPAAWMMIVGMGAAMAAYRWRLG